MFPSREIPREPFNVQIVDPNSKIPVSLKQQQNHWRFFSFGVQKGSQEKIANTAAYEQLSWQTEVFSLLSITFSMMGLREMLRHNQSVIK